MAFFKYLLYRIFILLKKKHDNNESAITALILVNLFMYLNIFALGGLLNKLKLLPIFFRSKIQVIAFIIILLIVNYFILIHNENYLKIYEKFDNETNDTYKRKG